MDALHELGGFLEHPTVVSTAAPAATFFIVRQYVEFIERGEIPQGLFRRSTSAASRILKLLCLAGCSVPRGSPAQQREQLVQYVDKGNNLVDYPVNCRGESRDERPNHCTDGVFEVPARSGEAIHHLGEGSSLPRYVRKCAAKRLAPTIEILCALHEGLRNLFDNGSEQTEHSDTTKTTGEPAKHACDTRKLLSTELERSGEKRAAKLEHILRGAHGVRANAPHTIAEWLDITLPKPVETSRGSRNSLQAVSGLTHVGEINLSHVREDICNRPEAIRVLCHLCHRTSESADAFCGICQRLKWFHRISDTSERTSRALHVRARKFPNGLAYSVNALGELLHIGATGKRLVQRRELPY
ncbi:MAG: hypothetical protein J6R54_02065 [Bacteroidaceae bacterium]|nr:hypothetical protein [Bacteroidaceae bacterium]